jgi:hypothetical protein
MEDDNELGIEDEIVLDGVNELLVRYEEISALETQEERLKEATKLISELNGGTGG